MSFSPLLLTFIRFYHVLPSFSLTLRLRRQTSEQLMLQR
nr:MAG TPA: hypothetical protein [Caudoviricetes sp.]